MFWFRFVYLFRTSANATHLTDKLNVHVSVRMGGVNFVQCFIGTNRFINNAAANHLFVRSPKLRNSFWSSWRCAACVCVCVLCGAVKMMLVSRRGIYAAFGPFRNDQLTEMPSRIAIKAFADSCSNNQRACSVRPPKNKHLAHVYARANWIWLPPNDSNERKKI